MAGSTALLKGKSKEDKEKAQVWMDFFATKTKRLFSLHEGVLLHYPFFPSKAGC